MKFIVCMFWSVVITSYYSGDKIRLRWTGHVARAGERALVGTPEGKRPLGRPRRRWEDNIKMDLQEVECWGYRLDGAGSG